MCPSRLGDTPAVPACTVTLSLPLVVVVLVNTVVTMVDTGDGSTNSAVPDVLATLLCTVLVVLPVVTVSTLSESCFRRLDSTKLVSLDDTGSI